MINTIIKVIDNINNEKLYTINGSISAKCLVQEFTYITSINQKELFRLDLNIHVLYAHNSKNYNYLVLPKNNNLDMETKYKDYIPINASKHKNKYVCDLSQMPTLISNIKNYPSGNLDLVSNKIIRSITNTDRDYDNAYGSIEEAVNDFDQSGCQTFYRKKTKNPNWTWNDMTNIPGWGWPYHCSTTGGGCERITDKIPWKDYHYVDISTCTDGIYWKETIYNNNNGNVQLEKKPACPTPPPTCQGELVTDWRSKFLITGIITVVAARLVSIMVIG